MQFLLTLMAFTSSIFPNLHLPAELSTGLPADLSAEVLTKAEALPHRVARRAPGGDKTD